MDFRNILSVKNILIGKQKFAYTLAEGDTHVGMPNNKRKFAFTLAEVLITLGIIGVVSVLTIPNIISNYQKKVYVTQLQKGYAQLQQVFDMAMADDEVEYLADTELMNSINGESVAANVDQSAFISQLGKYMKIQKACEQMDFSDGCHDVYYVQLNDSDNYIYEEGGYSKAGSNRGGSLQVFTKDGMIYYFHHFDKVTYHGSRGEECEESKADGAVSCSYHTDSSLLIDVNGKKGPNRHGRDLFNFIVDERGQVHPFGSSAVYGKKYAWDGEIGSASVFHSCTTDSYGTGCAGRIMDEGWKMDY